MRTEYKVQALVGDTTTVVKIMVKGSTTGNTLWREHQWIGSCPNDDLTKIQELVTHAKSRRDQLEVQEKRRADMETRARLVVQDLLK